MVKGNVRLFPVSLKEQVAISTGGGSLVSAGRIPGGPLGKRPSKNKLFQEDHQTSSRWKVKVDSQISDEMAGVLKRFLRFCQKKLDIKQPPVIYLLSKRAPGMTTGGYNQANNSILALSANRLLLDVLKTLAHELTHRMQDERGDFKSLKPRVDENDNSDLNTPYENEAYINSGNYVKEFCRLYRGKEKERLYSLHEGVALDEAPKPEALPSDPFGQYLFGQQRKLPGGLASNAEKDTPDERELADDLDGHFHGDMGQLSPWIPTLSDLEKKGKYRPVLSVPPKYKLAYRVMHNLSGEDLAKAFGIPQETLETTPMKLASHRGGVFYPRKGTQRHYSWTVSPNVFKRILNDWGAISSRFRIGHGSVPSYLVFFRAPIHLWNNEFLLNPEQTDPFSQEYKYQKEIISVGEIDCDRIWYMNINNTTEEDPYSRATKGDIAGISKFTTANRKEKPKLKPLKRK